MRRFALFAFCALLGWVLGAPATAWGEAGPSSGTIIAAAMETAAYVSQAHILSSLTGMLTRLGALIYVCVVLSLLIVTAMSGRYQTALWIFAGPPIFFFLIRAESAAAGVEWQFGPFRDQRDLQTVLRGANLEQSEGQRVSNFFHHYNLVISSTVQQLITVVTNDDVRAQMKFMARQKVIDDLFGATIDDPGLWQLTRFTFLQCHQELSAARLIAQGQREPRFQETVQYQNAVEEFCELYPLQDKQLPRGPAHDYVQALFLDLPLNEEAPQLRLLSCEELWQYMYLGAIRTATQALRESLLRNMHSQIPDFVEEEAIRDIRERLAERHSQRGAVPRGFSCDYDDGYAVSATATGYEGIPIIFATWMIRRVFGASVMEGRQDAVIFPESHLEPAAMGASLYTSHNRAQSTAIVQRFRADQLGESMKYEVYTLAKILPYLQGAGLYFLGTMYPFFCLLVILPGHAGGFFVWCALWAWLKMWDVGWALVYVADELLWELMPRRTYFRMSESGSSLDIPADPVTVLEAAFSGDYGYSLTTYWVLLAGLMSAVPIVTAHAVLGSKRAIAGIFVDGSKGIAKVFSQSAADWLAMEQLVAVDLQQQNRLFNRARVELDQQIVALANMQQATGSDALRGQGLNAAREFQHALNAVATSVNGWLPEGWRLEIPPLPDAGAPAEGHAPGNPNSVGNQLYARLHAYDLTTEAGRNSLGADLDLLHQYLNSGGAEISQAELYQRLNITPPPSTIRSDENMLSPDPDLQVEADEIEAIRRDANMMAGLSRYFDYAAGQSAAAAGGAAAITLVPGTNRFFQLMQRSAGGVALTGATLTAELYRLSSATRILSLEMERSSNAASAHYLHLCAAHYFYEALRSDEFAMLERVRAGITNRVEWWSIPEGASQAAARVPMEASIGAANLSVLGRGWLTRADTMGLQSMINAYNAGAMNLFRLANAEL